MKAPPPRSTEGRGPLLLTAALSPLLRYNVSSGLFVTDGLKEAAKAACADPLVGGAEVRVGASEVMRTRYVRSE